MFAPNLRYRLCIKGHYPKRSGAFNQKFGCGGLNILPGVQICDDFEKNLIDPRQNMLVFLVQTDSIMVTFDKGRRIFSCQ